jgi:hypothetical protein
MTARCGLNATIERGPSILDVPSLIKLPLLDQVLRDKTDQHRDALRSKRCSKESDIRSVNFHKVEFLGFLFFRAPSIFTTLTISTQVGISPHQFSPSSPGT